MAAGSVLNAGMLLLGVHEAALLNPGLHVMLRCGVVEKLLAALVPCSTQPSLLQGLGQVQSMDPSIC